MRWDPRIYSYATKSKGKWGNEGASRWFYLFRFFGGPRFNTGGGPLRITVRHGAGKDSEAPRAVPGLGVQSTISALVLVCGLGKVVELLWFLDHGMRMMTIAALLMFPRWQKNFMK